MKAIATGSPGPLSAANSLVVLEADAPTLRPRDLFDDGVLRSTLQQRFGPLTVENLRAAHELQESGRAIGKSVLGTIAT